MKRFTLSDIKTTTSIIKVRPPRLASIRRRSERKLKRAAEAHTKAMQQALLQCLFLGHQYRNNVLANGDTVCVRCGATKQ